MPPRSGGKVVRQPPKGDCISTPAGRLYGFRRQRRYKKWRRRRRTSPAQRYYITPEGGALNPSGRRQPVPDRTLGAQGQRPGGAINPRGEAASTFGNTGKHRPGPDPDRPTGLVHKRPLPPLTRSPSPIDGGGKCEGKKQRPGRCFFSVFQCSHDFVDVFYVIFIAPFIHFVHDAFHGCGVGQVGGAYLHGAGAGHHEFDGVFAGHDAA